VVIKRLKVLRIYGGYFVSVCMKLVNVAASHLKNPIKRCQAKKSQTTLHLFTGGYDAYLALVPSHESGVKRLKAIRIYGGAFVNVCMKLDRWSPLLNRTLNLVI
jgi:hypothetical protein